MNAAASTAAATGPLFAHSQSLAAIVDAVGASTLSVLGRRDAIASAVVWRSGLVVTAAHAFRRTPAAVELVGEGGRRHAATLVGIDSSTDLALFRLVDEAGSGLAAVAAGDAAGVKAGHVVIAVGRGGAGDATASAGIVNRAAGPWQTWLGGAVDRLIRLDGGVYEGLSGAAVADASGAVIGIATSALSRHYGIVVPASTVSRVVDALLANGRIARPWLGIGAQPVPVAAPAHSADGADAADAADATHAPSRTGLLVTALAGKGPAERAGVLVGDILIAAAGHAVADLGQLRAALAAHVGKPVPLSLLRGGVATELQADVGEWPAARRCG